MSGYTEPNFPLYFHEYDLRMDKYEGINYVIGNAASGNKSIGFFHSPVNIKQSLPLKSECIVLTTSLPETLSTPVIFCKKISYLKNKLTTAIKVSAESNLTVIIVINESVLFNYWDDIDFEFDNERIRPFLSKKTLREKLTTEQYLDNLNVAEALLSRIFPPKKINGRDFSFYKHNSEFFDYLLPFIKTETVQNLEEKPSFDISQYEESFFRMISLHYNLSLQYNKLYSKKPLEHKPVLCPGCPFITLMSQMDIAGYLVFSDIKCKSIYKHLDINEGSPDFAAGLCNNKSCKCMFIGNLSSFNHSLKVNSKNLDVILLDDLKVKQSFYQPVKFNKVSSVNILFPYSCNNIEKNSKPKVLRKKCICLKNGEDLYCIEKTYCPAIYLKEDTVEIDSNICTGCRSCASACPYGAVK